MQYVIDIILLLIFGLVVFISTKKGFFKTISELAVYIISLIAAKLLSSTLAPIVYDNFVYSIAKNQITKKLGEVGQKDYAGQAAAVVESIPKSFDGILTMIGIDRTELMTTIENSHYSGKNLVDNIMDNIVSPVFQAIAQTVLFILLSIILAIILRLIIRSLNKIIKKLPALKQINASLGALFGVIKGILVVMILALLIGACSGLTHNDKVVKVINDSVIVSQSQQLLDSISGYTSEF